MLPSLTLVLGGASSGKSAFAEGLLANHPNRIYLATSQVFDDEMRAKVLRHAQARGPDWSLVESPFDAAAELVGLTRDQTVLLDCATMWLTNHMLDERDLKTETTALLNAFSQSPASVVVVSNELGMGVVPETSLGRRFRDAQGKLNQDIAAAADLVVFVIAGQPLGLKGQLP